MKNLTVIEGRRLKSLHATSPTHGDLYGVVFSGIFLPLPAKIFYLYRLKGEGVLSSGLLVRFLAKG